MKIAQKIFSMKPSISAKDQANSFAYYHSISQRMRQIPTTRINKGISSVESLLPPIKDATANEEMMTTKENEGGEAYAEELPPIQKSQEMMIDSSTDLSKQQVVKIVEPLRKKSTIKAHAYVKQASSLSAKAAEKPSVNRGSAYGKSETLKLNKDKDRQVWEADQKLKRVDDRRGATKVSPRANE